MYEAKSDHDCAKERLKRCIYCELGEISLSSSLSRNEFIELFETKLKSSESLLKGKM